jgi:hypothetical protein
MRVRGQRWSDEDGREASSRNWGRLALALIPAALALAAMGWAAATFGWMGVSRERRLLNRTMTAVGIQSEPTAQIVIAHNDAPCLKIESSFMDGSDVVFYARNACQRWLRSPAYSIRAHANDGTVTASVHYAFDGDRQIGPKERREQRVTTLDPDTRTAKVTINAID